MANVEMCADQFQRDKSRSSGVPSAGDQPLGGGGPQSGQSNRSDYPHQSQDGAFERFLSSAIIAILTVLFSWRMLMLTSTDGPNSAGQSHGQRTGQCADHEEATISETEKSHSPGSPLRSGNDFSTENEPRNMKSNSRSADHNPVGSVVMVGQSSMGDGGFNSSSSSHRSSVDNSPEADIGEATDDVKWAEHSSTPHCDSGELSGAANRYVGNTSSRRPQIFKAVDCVSKHSRNGDYLDRKDDIQAESDSEGNDEGEQRLFSHSPLGVWGQPHRRNDTTETELQSNRYA